MNEGVLGHTSAGRRVWPVLILTLCLTVSSMLSACNSEREPASTSAPSKDLGTTGTHTPATRPVTSPRPPVPVDPNVPGAPYATDSPVEVSVPPITDPVATPREGPGRITSDSKDGVTMEQQWARQQAPVVTGDSEDALQR